MKHIFSPKDLKKYAEERLFGSNIKSEVVFQIQLHNGSLPSELEYMLNQGGSEWDCVKQKNSREPIYFRQGHLFIPQYSGHGRQKRYEEMIKAYNGLDNNFGFRFESTNNDHELRNKKYDDFAFDFVKGLFVPENKYEKNRVFEGIDAKNISNIIFGPTKAVAKQAKVLSVGNSEYLDSQIVEVGGEKILNLGYVYSDQAGIIIDKLLNEYEIVAEKANKKRKIDIYMFGRVGALAENLKRHDLVYPTGIIDEIDLLKGQRMEYPMNNVLAPKKYRGLNYNVTSVVNETVKQLDDALSNDCICVEMETRESVESINRARRRYYSVLDINFGFVGYVSDHPLKNDTLAVELIGDKGEQAALKKIVKYIHKTQ